MVDLDGHQYDWKTHTISVCWCPSERAAKLPRTTTIMAGFGGGNAFSSFGPAGNFSSPNRQRYGLGAANAARAGGGTAFSPAPAAGAANFMGAFGGAAPTAAPATPPAPAWGQTATPPAAGASLWGSRPDPIAAAAPFGAPSTPGGAFGAPPTPVAGGWGAAPAAGVDYRARLIQIWTQHAPQKLATVDAVLAKYRGREALVRCTAPPHPVSTFASHFALCPHLPLLPPSHFSLRR